MKFEKNMVIVIVLMILTTPSLSIISIAAEEDKSFSAAETTTGDDSYIIDGVPYIGQETDFYCTYTCPTMICKYYGINTSLYEVMYNSGVGYSLVYSHPLLKRFLIACTGTSNWETDRSFLASLYGLSYEESLFNSNPTEDERWTEYWSNIKQNITNNVPVLTIVDPHFLSSIKNTIRKELNISEKIWDRIPDWLWYFFPSTFTHVIVIVGFNESNGTICYNDPATALFGHPECGTYAWMNLTDFRKGMRRLSRKIAFSYSVGVFKNQSGDPLNKTAAFELAHERNIKRMKGNLSVYDEYVVYEWGCSNLGINALKEFEKNLRAGIRHRITTIFLYKIKSTMYLFSLTHKIYYLFDKFLPSIVDLSDYQSMMNYCYQLAVEKQDISQYLWETQYLLDNTSLSEICRRDAILLSYEAENCTKLASNFSKFLGRGVFLTLPRAILIANKMANIAANMQLIEKEIIGETT